MLLRLDNKTDVNSCCTYNCFVSFDIKTTSEFPSCDIERVCINENLHRRSNFLRQQYELSDFRLWLVSSLKCVLFDINLCFHPTIINLLWHLLSMVRFPSLILLSLSFDNLFFDGFFCAPNPHSPSEMGSFFFWDLQTHAVRETRVFSPSKQNFTHSYF